MLASLVVTLPAVVGWLQPDLPIVYSVSQSPDGNSDLDRLRSPFPGASAGTIKASDRAVLVVDDEPDIRTMLRELLQLEGYIVNDAADGVVALAHLRASARPLIVLLDYKMPRMNGEELLEVVMADSQLAGRHAFIFLTANLPAFSPALLQLLADAAIPVVQKPFHITAVLDEIDRAIVHLQTSPDPPVS
jgi:CheY-like chemotaxis protein